MFGTITTNYYYEEVQFLNRIFMLLFTATMLISFNACSSDDEATGSEDKENNTEKHTFSLTLENKENASEEIAFSGEAIIGEKGGAIYKKEKLAMRISTISIMFLTK